MNVYNNIYFTLEDKVDKIAGFFMGAGYLGYSFNAAWELMLKSEAGMKILNNDLKYVVHQQGITSAKEADKEIGDRIVKGNPLKMSVDTSNLLGEFIILAHEKYNIPYEKIFLKYPIDKFMYRCGVVLGNYDDKLIKNYLL